MRSEDQSYNIDTDDVLNLSFLDEKKLRLHTNYPMVAPSYAESRSKLAKKIGLGRKPRKKQENWSTSAREGGDEIWKFDCLGVPILKRIWPSGILGRFTNII